MVTPLSRINRFFTADASNPAIDAFVITKSNTDNCVVPFRGIYVGGAGDIVVVTASGNVVPFIGVLAGSILPVEGVRVNSTSTTATNMVGLV
jgi:hypothetical protein